MRDQSGFSLLATVVYAWQEIGARLEIPSGKSKWQSVLGFMWQGCQKFSSFVFEGNTTSEIVIECIDKIARKLNTPTVLVMDNAPLHRSAEFAEKIEEREQKGLDIYYLPIYSSERAQNRNVMEENQTRMVAARSLSIISKTNRRVR